MVAGVLLQLLPAVVADAAALAYMRVLHLRSVFSFSAAFAEQFSFSAVVATASLQCSYAHYQAFMSL